MPRYWLRVNGQLFQNVSNYVPFNSGWSQVTTEQFASVYDPKQKIEAQWLISNFFLRFGQNLRKVNRLEVNGKIFQICLKTVISRFLGMFDHLEKVSINSEECLFCVPSSVQGTNAEILTKIGQISRKVNRLEVNGKIFLILL